MYEYSASIFGKKVLKKFTWKTKRSKFNKKLVNMISDYNWLLNANIHQPYWLRTTHPTT